MDTPSLDLELQHCTPTLSTALAQPTTTGLSTLRADARRKQSPTRSHTTAGTHLLGRAWRSGSPSAAYPEQLLRRGGLLDHRQHWKHSLHQQPRQVPAPSVRLERNHHRLQHVQEHAVQAVGQRLEVAQGPLGLLGEALKDVLGVDELALQWEGAVELYM